MISKRAQSYLENLDMTDVQRSAAIERERAVVVTAGAGSGKTRTLVARYLSLLADGIPPEAAGCYHVYRKSCQGNACPGPAGTAFHGRSKHNRW